MKYLIVIERTATGYSAYSPGRPVDEAGMFQTSQRVTSPFALFVY